MGRSCSVCSHDERDSIDEQLVAGVGYRNIAERTGTTIAALSRHRSAHVSEALHAVVVEREHERGGALLDRIEALVARCETILDDSTKPSQQLAAIRELRALLELLGKASGELRPDGLVQIVNLVAAPEWLSIRAAVLRALGAFPEAQAAVTGALAEVEVR